MMKMSAAASSLGALGSLPLMGQQSSGVGQKREVPVHLKDHAELYQSDPMAAARKWFREAKYGLFVHYGIYSLMAAGEWVLYSKKVPLKEYNKLAERFTAKNFDVDQITDLALEGGMKYITFTSRHHDSYCMFDTKHSDFNSMNSPCKRDFIGEFAEQCRQKGLAFFPYYSEISARLDVFTPQKTYDMIHKLQPHALISAKWGITETEDFYAPEFHQFFGNHEKMPRDIPMEICDKLGSDWGWRSNYQSRGADFLRKSLAHTAYWDSNLLINTGPKPDGSLFEGDVKAIREVGREIKKNGFPEPKNFTGHMHQRQRDQLIKDQLELIKAGRVKK